jgi:transposase
MPAPLALALRPEQAAELTHLRDHAPTPYVRERAAAILKVAAGQSLRAVARSGLLRPRHRETVAAWVRRYLSEGGVGLRVRPGRGRKPAFSPSVRSAGADGAE